MRYFRSFESYENTRNRKSPISSYPAKKISLACYACLCFMSVPALIQIVFLKAVCRSIVLPISTFSVFPFLRRVFPLPLATLPIIVSSSSTLHGAIKIKRCLCYGLFFPGNLDHRHWPQEVTLSHWFAVSGGDIISWRSVSYLLFMS